MNRVWSKADKILDLIEREPLGILLFREVPSVMVYGDKSSEPFIMEWVDSTSDHSSNTYMWYQVPRHALKSFVEGRIDILSLEGMALGGLFYLHDFTNDVLSRPEAVSSNELPKLCWAKPGVLFKAEESTNLARVVQEFDLSNVKDETFSQVEDLSVTLDRGLFYLHLKHSKGVSLGRINTATLTRTLGAFNDLYREVRFDLKDGRNRGEVSDTKKNATDIEDVSTETLAFMRASFGVIVKPYDTNLFNSAVSEAQAAKIVDMLTSVEVDGAKPFVDKWSPFVVEKYGDLLAIIKKDGIDMDMVWTKQRVSVSYSIDDAKAAKLQKELRAASTEDTNTIKEKGMFIRLHVDTAYFFFEALSGMTYSGKFSDLTKGGMDQLKFSEVYEVVISQTIKIVGGKSETTNHIESCLPAS